MKYLFAYLDPGTGSYVFQVVVGMFLGVIFAAKMYWRSIKSFFSNLFNKERAED